MMPKHVGALCDYILSVRCAFFGVMNEYIATLNGMKSVMKIGAVLSSKHSDRPVVLLTLIS
jgi:hypothetical protein